jgi:HlyD family secretion protein
MKPRRNRIVVGIALVLVALAIVAVIYSRANAKASSAASLQTATAKIGNVSTTIAASGTVRAAQSATLSWQNTGSVGTVSVQAGDGVTEGQELASLSTDQMPANVISAAVDLATAQQTLDNLLHSTTPQANAQKALQDAQAALDDYKNNFPATQAAAQAALTTAQYNLTVAQNKKTTVQYAKASPADIEAARATLTLALNNLEAASTANNKASDLPTSDPRRSQALTNLADAEKKVESAQMKLNWYLTYPTAQDIANTDAAVLAAQAALATAQQSWNAVKDGPNTTQLAVLQAAVADAQNAYDLIKNGASQGDVAAVNARIAGDRSTLNTMKITAPFSGTITTVSVLPNDQASSGTAAFTINDLSHLYIDVTVAETNLPKVQDGQAVEFIFNAISGKTFHGKVVKVAQVGTSSQGVVNFGVTVEITDADKNVRLGMAATVNLITASKQNVLLVPSRAITTSGTQKTVNVLYEGNQISLPVTVGMTNGTLAEITGGGLKEGDVVVLNAASSSSSTSRNFIVGGGGGGFSGPPGGFGD